jgi:hypothetical protein
MENNRLKLSFCLALVLGGGLFGCSTMPAGALSKSAEGKLFSNQESICLKSNDSSRPWNLNYALTEGELFVTVHSRGEVDSYDELAKWRPEYTAAIYVKAGDKFKLLKRLSTEGQSYFLKPAIFPVHIERADIKDDWKQLIKITEKYYGSGGLTEEHVFTAAVMNIAVDTSPGKFTQDVKLDEVEFIPASQSYHFGKDERLKWESDTLADYNLSFTFSICNLSGKDFRAIAKVTGTYKLEQEPDGKLRIIMDKFKREPITNSNSP